MKSFLNKILTFSFFLLKMSYAKSSNPEIVADVKWNDKIVRVCNFSTSKYKTKKAGCALEIINKKGKLLYWIDLSSTEPPLTESLEEDIQQRFITTLIAPNKAGICFIKKQRRLSIEKLGFGIWFAIDLKEKKVRACSKEEIKKIRKSMEKNKETATAKSKGVSTPKRAINR